MLQFLSQPPCCFATSPLTKGGKPPQITAHCSSSLLGVKRRSNPQPLMVNTKIEKKKFINRIIMSYTEIATSCKQLSQWRVCEYHPLPPSSLRAKRSNPQPQKVNAKTKNKKNSLFLYPFVIARLRRSRGNPQTTIFLFIHRKEKEIIIIYQIKELILNKILIFNF